MIVKFLRPATTFKGVGYSFAKMLLDKGELMQVSNFHALAGLSNPRPEDYVNYLEVLTRQSKRIVYPQLHVTISTKNYDHSKYELTEIAGKWLNGMGYGDNPYLIVFHNDTRNNHVHIVSTRIGRDGKKIKDSFEHINGYEVLNQVLGLNESLLVQKDIQQALSYSFSTKAQFMMLLELKGYTLTLNGSQFQIIKFGKQQENLAVEKVEHRISVYQRNKERLQQLRAIIEKYRPNHNPELSVAKSKLPGGGEGKSIGYSSDLADMLQRKFGIQILFHAKDGKAPYGYTVFDHSIKTVFKGGDLMPLAEFIKAAPVTSIEEKAPNPTHQFQKLEFDIQDEQIEMTKETNGDLFSDTSDEYYLPLIEYTSPGVYVPPLRIDISDDIDDEQINGRNRRRKRKARTNTR